MLRALAYLAIILLAVTLPIAALFVGNPLAAGEYLAAAQAFAFIAGVLAVPVIAVALVAVGLVLAGRRFGRQVHPAAAAGVGALAGVAVLVPFMPLAMAAMFGAIPGAGVALAVLPPRADAD